MLIRLSRARLAGVACGVLLAACAGAPASQAPAPADIPALEAKRAAAPGDPAVNLRLAEAYYGAGRYADARAALATVLAARPGDAEARVYLGYTYEGLNQFDSARAVYTALEAERLPRAVRRLLAGRLELVSRAAMLYAARQALAQESTLTRTPPPPNTVAVMPFEYTGTDSAFQPLERGLAALVVTDLARVKSLQLVERERLQALLDEMQLTASGRVDPATGARSGRLVGAASVVEGQFTTDSAGLALQASVVRAADAGVAATGQGSDALDRLFDLEKQVVLQLIDRLGITLTPAEQVAITQRPTRDLQAFLLYSRGLQAEDQGDYAAAAQNFQAAAQRDPGFGAAVQGAQNAQAAQAAGATPPADLAADVGGGGGATPGGGTLLTAINNVAPSGAGLTTGLVPSALSFGLPPTDPNGVCEAAGCQGPPNATLIGTVIIIVKRP